MTESQGIYLVNQEPQREEHQEDTDWSKYPIMLEPKHVKEILNIGRRATYEVINQENPPFDVHRYGERTIRIPKASLRKYVEQGQ